MKSNDDSITECGINGFGGMGTKRCFHRLGSSLGKANNQLAFRSCPAFPAESLPRYLSSTSADSLFCIGYRGTVLVLCPFGIEIYRRISKVSVGVNMAGIYLGR